MIPVPQPISVEIKMADDIFVKSMQIQQRGTMVPQHAHEYDHVSMLAVGSVRVWKDGVLLGDFHAPRGILIEAKTKHRFLSLEDNTIIYCIHRLHDGAEGVDVHTQHQLTLADLEEVA